MKSPREILLQRHQHAAPGLDTIRHQAVRSLAARQTTRPTDERSWLTSIGETIRLPRIVWGTLAAAWLVIIVLNIASSDRFEPTVPPMAKGQTSSDTRQALREQRRLFVELANPSFDDIDNPAPRTAPRPRSARKPTIAFA
jgi:hypothetical protein